MTILQALDRYYDRIADVEAPGWSREKFGWCVVLSADGEPVDVLDLRELSGKRMVPKLLTVPAPKRTSNVNASFLWDKTAYSLGVTAGDAKRTAREHEDFRSLHLKRLALASDAALIALRRFVERWTPERFSFPPFKAEMLDANIAFRLDGQLGYVHDSSEVRQLVEEADASPAKKTAQAICLVTGQTDEIEDGHSVVKNVEGAQTSGAYLISYNKPAFESYGTSGSLNAPVSKLAAAKYVNALNRLLAPDSRNRVSRPIGDATVVFWADASDAKAAEDAEGLFGGWLDPPPTDADEARRLSDALEKVAKGRPDSALTPDTAEGTRFHVLGLSPNAARLSVRYWLTGSFREFAERLALHHEDLKIEPAPWAKPPSVNGLLMRTVALQEDYKNIPPLLAGEVMRAILSGGDYPRALLVGALIRLRAGGPKPDPQGRQRDIGWHAAVMRAVLHRAQRRRRADPSRAEKGETPMALERDHRNMGYQLGRLFAVYELAQIAALGRNVNATIRDKYFGGAAATPASVFPLIIKNGQNNLTKARKVSPGWAHLIERELEEIAGRIEPAMPRSLPRSLRLEDQAEFAIGYYHQRKAKLTSATGETLSLADADTVSDNEGEPQ